jgi:hypothetical protein
LQNKEKEVEGAVNFNYSDYNPNNYSVNLLDCEAKKEYADAEFKRHIRQDIHWLTCPPPLVLVN